MPEGNINVRLSQKVPEGNINVKLSQTSKYVMNRLMRTETPWVLKTFPANSAGEHCGGVYCRLVSCQQALG